MDRDGEEEAFGIRFEEEAKLPEAFGIRFDPQFKITVETEIKIGRGLFGALHYAKRKGFLESEPRKGE